MESPLHIIVLPDTDVPEEYRKNAWRLILEYPSVEEGTEFSAFAVISHSHAGAVDALLSLIEGQATCITNHEPAVSVWQHIPKEQVNA
jgi:hypothetical protein